MPHPNTTLQSRLVAIVEAFEREVDGVRGCAVADREGLPIANGFREAFDLTATTAMSTLAMESSQKVFEHLGLKGVRNVQVEGDDAKVVIFDLGRGQGSFIAVARPDTNVGLLKFHMVLAAKRLEQELGFAPKTGARIEEVFLLTKSGLLLSHTARSPVLSKDRDIFAGMFTVVQEFARDCFGERGGALEEMEMAHVRVRLVRGRNCGLAIIATGPMSTSFLAEAKQVLDAFEERNRAALNPWDGEVTSLSGTAEALEDLLDIPLE
ncbi:MAG: roadblock/LC7 domain-containing protein [Thermoplasmata archaeon]